MLPLPLSPLIYQRNKGCCENDVSDINSAMYQNSPTYYTTEIYEDLGKSTLISILDIFEKNPCTRIPGNVTETLDAFRTEIAERIVKIPRFWKEANIKRKCLKITEIVREIFYSDFEKKKVFNLTLSLKSPGPIRRAVTTLLNSQLLTSSLKKSPVNVGGRMKDVQSTVSIWSSNGAGDENVNDQEDDDVKSLPKLVKHNYLKNLC